MAKTLTDIYNDDQAYTLALQDLVVLDPAPSLNPTVSKAVTLDTLISFIADNSLSSAGTAAFASASSSFEAGTSQDIAIERSDYDAYPSGQGICSITVSNELTETTDYTLLLDGETFVNGGLATFEQYELAKVLTFISIQNTATVTITLASFSGFSAGSQITHLATIN